MKTCILTSTVLSLLLACGSEGPHPTPTRTTPADTSMPVPIVRPDPVNVSEHDDASVVILEPVAEPVADAGPDSAPDAAVTCSPLWNGDPATDPTAANSCSTDADCCDSGSCIVAGAFSGGRCHIACLHDSECPASLCNGRVSYSPTGSTAKRVCEGSMGGTP